ncbi:hypothetical protein PVIIG_06207 [Plasmodium vivax India VII]|uniref:VIR protein n=1 Tax=Plasmodium vivax India VII TaxID=1077284 RepID=A0A0J9SHJ2_PLAVI|nr:hypothetical protein PVIIG_06207 [Plasmodium vivax India VII]
MKKQFVDKIKEKRLDISSYINEFEPNYPQDKLQKLKNFSEVFTNFKKHLSNHHPIAGGNYNAQGTCNYISYLLYDGISKKKKGYCDVQTFNNFKDFADTYNARREGNMCVNMIKHLDLVDFHKREALYELYDMYNDRQLPHSNEKLSECDTLAHLTRIHNKIIADYEYAVNAENIDKDLYEKRIEMKELINKFKFRPGDCLHYDKLELHTSKYEGQEIEKKKELERQESARRELERQESARQELERQVSARRQALQKKQELLSLELANRQTSSLSSNTSELDSGENEVYREIKVNQDGQRGHILTNYPVGTGHSRSSQGGGPLDNNLVDEQVDYTYPSRLKVDSPLNAENPNSEDGIIGSMRSTLSSIVQNVDPVPVVGVSGGMGALFLLFRVLEILNLHQLCTIHLNKN